MGIWGFPIWDYAVSYGLIVYPVISGSIPIKLLLNTFMNIYNFAGEIIIFWAFVDHFASTMAIFLGVKPPLWLIFIQIAGSTAIFAGPIPMIVGQSTHVRPEKQPENPRRLNSAPQKRGTKSSSDLVPLLQDAARGAGRDDLFLDLFWPSFLGHPTDFSWTPSKLGSFFALFFTPKGAARIIVPPRNVLYRRFKSQASSRLSAAGLHPCWLSTYINWYGINWPMGPN